MEKYYKTTWTSAPIERLKIHNKKNVFTKINNADMYTNFNEMCYKMFNMLKTVTNFKII